MLVFPLSFKHCKYYCSLNIADSGKEIPVLPKLILAWYAYANSMKHKHMNNSVLW